MSSNSDTSNALVLHAPSVPQTMVPSDYNPANDLKTFTIFGKLPAELRVKIWKLKCHNEPRIVEVRFAEFGRAHKHDFVADIPAVLHASREARTEALKYYKLSFDNKKSLNGAWFNFDMDILYPRSASHIEQLVAFIDILPNKNMIQRLAISQSGWRYVYLQSYDSLGVALKPHLFKFTALKEVCTVMNLRPHGKSVCAICFSVLSRDNRTSFLDEAKMQEHKQYLEDDWMVKVLENAFAVEKGYMSHCLSRVHSHGWGQIQWNEPAFTYLWANEGAISGQDMYCLPHGPNKHATRARKRLQ